MERAAKASSATAMITGLFMDARSTERAYEAAIARGYKSSDINLMMAEETRRRHFAGTRVDADLAGKAQKSTERKPPDDIDATELGGPAGGTVGTIAPAAAAVGTAMLLPGLIFAGPVAIALAAAGAVGLAGGLVGMLTNWGIPKSRVEEYQGHIRDGGILMGVKPRSEEDARYLEQEWVRAGGRLVHG
jgi:hypothetical protein